MPEDTKEKRTDPVISEITVSIFAKTRKGYKVVI